MSKKCALPVKNFFQSISSFPKTSSVICAENKMSSPGLNARCVETEGGTSNGACCVFPFIYHGTQYFECMDDENKKPWCSTTSNYDIDGMWGHCLGKKAK